MLHSRRCAAPPAENSEASAGRRHVDRAQSGSPCAVKVPRESSPGVEIEIADMSTPRQIEALIAGRLDVGFVRLPVKHPRWRCESTDRAAYYCHFGQVRRAANAERHSGSALILIDRGASATYHDHCISLCDRSGFTPRIVYEPNDMFTILNLVSAGIGVSLAPAGGPCHARDRRKVCAHP